MEPKIEVTSSPRAFQDALGARLPGEAVFEGIAAGRGALSRGGRPDFNKVAELLLNELRSGKLGRLSFENPDQAFENPEQAIESPHQAPEER